MLPVPDPTPLVNLPLYTTSMKLQLLLFPPTLLPRDQVRQYSQEKLMPRILLDNRNERESNLLPEG